MSLWVDKYRPTNLDKLQYHNDLSQQLQELATTGDFPHILFYGPSGAGKKTRITCFLRELYGPGAEKLKIENKTFTSPSNAKVEISIISSNYHIEVNPSDAGMHDYTVVRSLLKEVAQTQSLDTSQKASRAFKVVVINEADKLTRESQHALRRIMEKYMGNCRYILCCNSQSKVIPAIRSRCLGIRVAAPTFPEIMVVLHFIAKKEGLKLPEELAGRIAEHSHRNLRRAILMFEACKVQQAALSADQQPQLCDWEVYIQETAKYIIKEQSANSLLAVRGRLYELLSHCIPADVIIKSLALQLIEKVVDTTMKCEVMRHAAEYEHRLRCGSKAIYHLEAFVAKFMSIYKQYLTELSAMDFM